MSTLIAIGHPYPFHDISDGTDKALLERTDAAFNLVCYLSQPSAREIQHWRTGGLRYGLYRDPSAPALPVLVFHYEGLVQFDTGCNIFKWPCIAETHAWLNAQGNAVFTILVDADTNRVLGLRALGLSCAFMRDFRQALQDQLVGYAGAAQVDAAIQELTERVSANDLSADTTFYRAGDPSGAPISTPSSRTHHAD